MADTAALTITKEFTYRGAPELWSNTYHLDQIPPDATAWANLSHLVVSLERVCYSAKTSVVQSAGHVPGNPVSVFEHDYRGDAAHPGIGTLPTAGFLPQAGDAAVWIRWGTTQMTSRGKRIYLRSYFHDVYSTGTAGVDELSSGQHDALTQYGTEWLNGMSSGGITYRRAGPRGAVAQDVTVSQWVTTRTLERRAPKKARVVTKNVYVPVTIPIVP